MGILPSLAFILFACKNVAFYTKQDLSRGHTLCSFVFFLNRLTANERALISRAVLEMEANAVLYIQKHISARLLAAVREMSPRSFSSWGPDRDSGGNKAWLMS